MQDGIRLPGLETLATTETGAATAQGPVTPEALWLAILEGQVAAVQANTPRALPLPDAARPRNAQATTSPLIDMAPAEGAEPPVEWLRQVMTQLAAGGMNVPTVNDDDALAARHTAVHALLDADAPPLTLTIAAAPSAPAAPTGTTSTSALSNLPTLPSPQSAGFGEAFAERVQWLAGKGVSEARIDINPREFGPIEIRIRIDGNGTNIEMTAAHATTRQAMTAALPRLGELFAAAGMVLNEAKFADAEERRAPRVRAADIDSEGTLHEGLLRRRA